MMNNSIEFVHGFLGVISKLNSQTIPPEVQQTLNRPLPREAIKQHPTKTYLSTIKSIYVIDRLNEAFGIGEWYADYQIIDNSSANIIVKGYLVVPKYGIYLTNFGGNDNGGSGSKNFDQGDAYKGACTDALTKITSYLGIGADVWRSEKPGTQRQSPQPQRPPQRTSVQKKALGENGFKKVIERFKDGEHDIVDKTMKIFELNAQQFAQIAKLKKELASAAMNGSGNGNGGA